MKWPAVTAIEPAPDGSIYVIERCFENSCEGRSEPPILKYNTDGKLLAAFANLFPINPVTAMFWSQALAGVLVVPILIFTLVLANDRRVMRTVNSFGENFWIGAAAGGMCAAVGVFAWMKLF